MKRLSVSGWGLLVTAAACIVIPASAQVPPPERGDNQDNAPHYVDNADYDPQPYYVDGVQYKPYVPEKKKARPTDTRPAAPIAPSDQVPLNELHPYVPPSSTSAAQADGAVKVASSTSSAVDSSANSAPKKRPRYGVAIIEAVDKVTAESVRFEAPLGKSIRYKGLIYTVKACETSADDEAMTDVMAYMRVRTNPVAATNTAPAVKSREIFRGWTFASTPSLNPIQHAVYDAWVVGCRQPLPGNVS
jgi:hypothetical protein